MIHTGSNAFNNTLYLKIQKNLNIFHHKKQTMSTSTATTEEKKKKIIKKKN